MNNFVVGGMNEDRRAEHLPVMQLASAAESAGLFYVQDDEPGFRRKCQGRGFGYFDPHGNLVRDGALRERFKALGIPPAWTDVWICLDADGHIQATGRDEKGRKQYIYHPRWNEIRNQAKFERILMFGEALPQLRARVEEDLVRRSLSREKVVAIVVRLLEETLIRIGNPEYARNNSSYGLTTLRNEHLEISGSRLRFVFQGKSGKQVEIDLLDRRLARMVRRCQELPGQRLFQYIGENGEFQVVTSSDVNRYLRGLTGQDFTAKDFRTWGATVLCLQELQRLGPAETEKQAQKNVVQAIKTVASALVNTPTICRKYYVHPAIIQAYLDGSLFTLLPQPEAQDGYAVNEQDAAEAAVVTLLRRKEV